LIEEVRLLAATSKRRTETASERIARKGFWIKSRLLGGCAILIERRSFLLIFQNLDVRVRAEVGIVKIIDTHHMPLEFQQTSPARFCRGLYLDGICAPTELALS
jgi:hypothetical protein